MRTAVIPIVAAILVCPHGALALAGDDSVHARPLGMTEDVYEAIRRLPASVDMFVMSQGRRDIFAENLKEEKAIDEPARIIDDDVFDENLDGISDLFTGHLKTLKSHHLVWCAHAIANFKPPPGLEDVQYESVYSYIVDPADADGIDRLWTAIQSDKDVTVRLANGTSIVRRDVTPRRSTVPFFGLRPRKNVLVVVRGQSLLNETVTRWSEAAELTKQAFPWTGDEWRVFDPHASTWAVRRASKAVVQDLGFTSLIMSINPKKDPMALRYEWCGNGPIEGISPASDGLPFPLPIELLRHANQLSISKAGFPIRTLVVRVPLQQEDVSFRDLRLGIRYWFGRAPWGL